MKVKLDCFRSKIPIPNKAWVDMTKEEQTALQPLLNSIGWKDEGVKGPVFITFRKLKRTYGLVDREMRHYQDGMKTKNFTFAAWFKKSEAKEIAKQLGIPLEEY